MRFISSSALSMESSGEHECSVLVISWCARACKRIQQTEAVTEGHGSWVAGRGSCRLATRSRKARACAGTLSIAAATASSSSALASDIAPALSAASRAATSSAASSSAPT
jgi:hypothetical protein